MPDQLGSVPHARPHLRPAFHELPPTDRDRLHAVPLELGGWPGQLWTVMLMPGLATVPTELEARDTKVYEPLGTVVVFQPHTIRSRLA